MVFGPLIHWLVRKMFDGVEDEEKKRRQILIFDIFFTTMSTFGVVVVILVYGEIASLSAGCVFDYSKTAICFHKKLT